ncbi:S41 family peptidase [Hymenobacter actinosclerus]|uniref:Peptidase family S41 n=1 Tax=Hymenobacter actinosclerus TaxID=82805 RepID=A0A1I0HWD1_9BACT|nr:S41 family peptidase [Hymenobacter actinosclerus]SET88376.1 Peptidase family S41 [Hymenobacter actinosclerus]
MRKICLALALPLAAATICLAQSPVSPVNLNFEQRAVAADSVPGWSTSNGKGYSIGLDSVEGRQGRYVVRLREAGAKDGQFGRVGQRIPVWFQGRSITLSGFMKTEQVSASGRVYLTLLQTDAGGATVAYGNTARQTVRGTTGWQRYEVTLPLNADATELFFGGILEGQGTAWLDDLQLTIDGKPLDKAPTKTIRTYLADQDTAFRRESGVVLPAQLSAQQLENLAVLGRVWGFVKYYHPAVAAGNFNLDAELFRVLPAVLAAPDEPRRSQLLGAWVTRFGPVPACRKCADWPANKVRQQPDLAWLNDEKQLGTALRDQLRYLRENRNQSAQHYYVAFDAAGNPLFRHELPYAAAAGTTPPDDGVRLLALYRYWNMIAYFFPYRYAIGEDWQPVLPEFIPKLAAARTPEQYRLAALALIARIHDSHANIFQDEVLNKYRGLLYAPVRLRFVENQAVVTDYYHKALGAATGLQKGDIIVSVDGVPVPELVRRWQPLAPASNEPTQLRDIANLLLRGNTAQLPLLVRRDGREFPVTISRYPNNGRLNLALNSGTPDKAAPTYLPLPGNIGYLVLGTLTNERLPEIMRDVAGTKGLIIDIRNYPAEFVTYTLTSYLLKKPAPFVQFSRMDILNPGAFPLAPPVLVKPGASQFYPGKVVVLVNELTQSNAEFTAMALRTAPNVTVMGSTTAGADGNVSAIVLPGNIPTRITGLGVYYPDGRETQRIGIVPDIEVHPTIQGIKEGRDEVLERAVALIQGN